jgi:peptide/nickel transport system ATP-binding protein
MLEVYNLKTHFFTRHGVAKAVDDVSFIVPDGVNLGIIGESGSGKSMTALSILRLVPFPGRILDGSVLLDGDDLLKKTPSQMRRIRGSKISIILQDPLTSLNPVYHIGNQVGESIRLHQGIKGNALLRKIVDALKLVRLSEAEARVRDFPHQMSGGMRQRVVGAIALSCRPRLLIADEPTTSLDLTTQAQYLEVIREVQNELGISVIFITHDLGIVAHMCDQVAVMYGGKIVESGKALDIFDNALHPYTKALMHCLPKVNAGSKLKAIEGDVPDLRALPPGCSFSPRCLEKTKICEEKYPEEITLNSSHEHKVSCWLYC